MLRYRRPPGYRRAQPVRRPKLDAFTGIIDQILREDQSRPKKQRHTAKRIGERLRAEYGFTGGDTIVKASVRAQRLGGQEMFVPLAHPPGDAQADFGEALVVIAGVECKAHYLVVDLPHSDDGFVQAFPAGDDGGVLRRAQRRVRLLRWRAAAHRLRQHDAGGGADSRGRHAPADAGLLRTPIALFIRRSLRAAGEGQRQRQGGRAGRVRPPQLLRADPPVRQLGRVERRLSAQVRRTSRAPVTAAHGRRSGSASPATARRCCRYRRSRMTPATRGRRGSRRCRWCATAATTTRCRPPTATGRCW